MYTQQDQIWISLPKEIAIVKQLSEFILSQGFETTYAHTSDCYGYPFIFNRNGITVSFRFVDSAFLYDTDAWVRPGPSTIITDNILLNPIAGNLLSALPEFWSIWSFKPEYIDRPATKAFNCFMNRVSGERSITFYELVKRNILEHGFVSYNCNRPGDAIWSELDTKVCQANYESEYVQADIQGYEHEHQQGKSLIPYNTINDTVEQCIIDSNVSLVLETYTSDNHIMFSEKIFRVLQLPRPWLLYCSPTAVEHLRSNGFDVLDDYVDHLYDQHRPHHQRLLKILDQLETFIDRQYTAEDYQRFDQAAEHNRNLLKKFEQHWPEKFNSILEEIKKI